MTDKHTDQESKDPVCWEVYESGQRIMLLYSEQEAREAVRRSMIREAHPLYRHPPMDTESKSHAAYDAKILREIENKLEAVGPDLIEAIDGLISARTESKSKSAPQDLPVLPPGWVWQWVDREGTSYDLHQRPPLGGDLACHAESGPCEGDGAGDAVGAWRRAYEVATATECKSVAGVPAALAEVPAAPEPDPGNDPGPERAWIRVRGISIDQSSDSCDLHVHAVSLDTKPGPGTWREYVRADLARTTECRSVLLKYEDADFARRVLERVSELALPSGPDDYRRAGLIAGELERQLQAIDCGSNTGKDGEG